MKKRKNGMPVPVTEKVIEVWKEWVRRRWNPEAKFLNLEVSHSYLRAWLDTQLCVQRIASDEYLKRHRLTSPTSDAANREAQVIFKIASKLRPEVRSTA